MEIYRNYADYLADKENQREMFVSRPINDWVAEAASRPNPRQLWHELWYEGEVACLFADTNMGKSIYALQIAEEVARHDKVIYFDFEMSDKQLQLRYTAEDGRLHSFPDKLIRAEFAQSRQDEDLDSILRFIRRECARHDCRIVIIDNITWICNRSESGDSAGELMASLCELKREFGLSILVLAHTPKRAVTSKLTQNSLAGSKRIANFLDSMMAIGLDSTNLPAGRYIKQIKVRNCEMRYGEDNVITALLCRDDDRLVLKHTGYGRECDLLAGDIDDQSQRSAALEMQSQGLTYRDIAQKLGVGRSTVCRWLKDSRPGNEPGF